MAGSQHARGDTEGEKAKAVGEKKKAWRSACGGRRFARLDRLGVGLEMEYEDVHFEEFQVGSRHSDFRFRASRSSHSPPSRSPSPQVSTPLGTLTWISGVAGWERRTMTTSSSRSSHSPLSRRRS